ncbi:MAG: TniB family NTP-binding protein [Rhodocyclaceae bacterium]
MVKETYVDIEDAEEAEERNINERRLKTYGLAALEIGAAVDSVKVLFTQFKAALEACDRIYELAKALDIPQGMVVTGPPGSSKTTLATYFTKSLPDADLVERGFGAVVIRLRNHPSLGHIVSCLLRALNYPFTQVRRGRVFAMRDISFEALKQRGTRLVFIDQGHCLSTQTRHRHQDVMESAASDVLREMMEEAKVGLVILADASFRGLEYVDKALADRVTTKMSLDYFVEGPEWHGFLKSFATNVKVVDLGLLSEKACAGRLLTATSGNRRTFKRLIIEAVLLSVCEGGRKVELKHLQHAFDLVNGVASGRSNPFAK